MIIQKILDIFDPRKHNMYLIFRCDCSRFLYSRAEEKTRGCPICGKRLKVRERKIFYKVNTAKEASEAVKALQKEEIR